MPPTFSKNFANVSPEKEKQPNKKPAPSGKRDIRYLLAISLCVITVLSTAGIYGANVYFDRQIVMIGENITNQREAIQLNTINDLILFDKQIHTLKDLSLSQRGYLTLLRAISLFVIDDVRYKGANLSLDMDGMYTVKVQGVAESPRVYLTLLEVIREASSQDSDIFAKRMNFDSYIIQRNQVGSSTISFTMSMKIHADEFITAETANRTL